jgi:hypothetical protein
LKEESLDHTLENSLWKKLMVLWQGRLRSEILNALTTARCIETGNMWRTNDPYWAPRPELKG